MLKPPLIRPSGTFSHQGRRICLITGANGFIGRPLCQYLLTHNYTIRGTIRKQSTHIPPPEYPLYMTGDIDQHTRWPLDQIDIIVHLAGTVHRPDIKDPNIYQRSIVEATRSLVEQAIQAQVKRLIYVSSSHVYGLSTTTTPLKEDHPCYPKTPYAQAKWQAEQLLQKYMGKTPLEIVIIRPPLVYGPEVRGNFAQLIKLIQTFPLLPFGCATQPRSLIGLDNLISFLHLCMEHPKAANGTFNITDDHDLSTRTLCEKLATILDKKRLFLPISSAIMRACLKACGQSAMYNKLFGAMQLDIQRAKEELGWHPPFELESGLGCKTQI